MNSSDQEANLSQTVLRALDVLECVAGANVPLNAAEIAKSCGLSRPTAYRLLATLQSRGYVANTHHEYSLGSKILSLSGTLLESLDLPSLTHSYLRELSEATGETVYISVLDDTEILYVNKVASTKAVHSNCTIGSRNYLHCSSMGKAILAFLPPHERDTILGKIAPFKAFTPNTITDQDALQQELERIRSQGYAIDDIEGEDNVRCVGAPIFDHVGRSFAAISLSGPAFRLSIEQLHELSSLVVDTAQSISHQLGYTPDKNR
ncbi:MAG: IclR family transcriptional regulator [Anaerolineae bacterium]|nr:IclR family transcriptional regulator [Anaerolineae bacterium]